MRPVSQLKKILLPGFELHMNTMTVGGYPYGLARSQIPMDGPHHRGVADTLDGHDHQSAVQFRNGPRDYALENQRRYSGQQVWDMSW